MSEALTCPNCDAPMDRLGFQGDYGVELDIDLCFSCHAMWLDKRESVRLSARGTLDLFKVLHEHEDDPRHALSTRLECARCDGRLALTHDIGKGGRFSYYKCAGGHGRFTPFSEFLKEKQFVRALNPAEKQRLKAEMKQVQCSSCGAPVNLGEGFQCGHCGASITVLDADAVEKTLRELEAKDEKASSVDVDEAARKAKLMAATDSAVERLRRGPEGSWQRSSSDGPGSSDLHTDLLSNSIAMLFKLF